MRHHPPHPSPRLAASPHARSPLQFEAYSGCDLAPVHVLAYSLVPYALMFPELLMNELAGWAAHQEPSGMIQEFLGDFSAPGGRLTGQMDISAGEWVGGRRGVPVQPGVSRAPLSHRESPPPRHRGVACGPARTATALVGMCGALSTSHLLPYTHLRAGGRTMGDVTSVFILATLAVWRSTNDTAWLATLWSAVTQAAEWQMQRATTHGCPSNVQTT